MDSEEGPYDTAGEPNACDSIRQDLITKFRAGIDEMRAREGYEFKSWQTEYNERAILALPDAIMSYRGDERKMSELGELHIRPLLLGTVEHPKLGFRIDATSSDGTRTERVLSSAGCSVSTWKSEVALDLRRQFNELSVSLGSQVGPRYGEAIKKSIGQVEDAVWWEAGGPSGSEGWNDGRDDGNGDSIELIGRDIKAHYYPDGDVGWSLRSRYRKTSSINCSAADEDQGTHDSNILTFIEHGVPVSTIDDTVLVDTGIRW